MRRPVLARGDIVLTPLDFTDFTGSKVRPALIVSPGAIGNDVILMAISSVVRGVVAPTDLLMPDTHPEFAGTGLRVTSVLRAHNLVTVERAIIMRRLGHIGVQLQAQVDSLLRQVLAL